MANEITSIKIGDTEYPIDFSKHSHSDLTEALDDLGEALNTINNQVTANTAGLSDLLGKAGLDATGTVTKIIPGVGLKLSGKSDGDSTAISSSGTINLQVASSSEIGGIQIGYTESGKNYPVELNSSNQAYVNVPWEEYEHPTDGANTTKGPTATVTGTEGATIKVPKITVDSFGHVTALSEYTYTSKNTEYGVMAGATATTEGTSGLVPIPVSGKQTSFLRGDGAWEIPSGTTYTEGTNITISGTTISSTDTKNTAGSTNTSSKIFLIGATSQAAEPQTYSHDTVYVDTTGALYSEGKKVIVVNSLPSSSRSYYYTDAKNASTTYSLNNTAGTTSGSISSNTKYIGSVGSYTYTIALGLAISGSSKYMNLLVPAGYTVSGTLKTSFYSTAGHSIQSINGVFGFGNTSTVSEWGVRGASPLVNGTNTITAWTNNGTASKTIYLKAYIESVTVYCSSPPSGNYSPYIVCYANVEPIKIYKTIPATNGALPNGVKNIIDSSGHIACAPTYTDVFLNLPSEFFVRKGNYCLSIQQGYGIRYSKDQGKTYTTL